MWRGWVFYKNFYVYLGYIKWEWCKLKKIFGVYVFMIILEYVIDVRNVNVII